MVWTKHTVNTNKRSRIPNQNPLERRPAYQWEIWDWMKTSLCSLQLHHFQFVLQLGHLTSKHRGDHEGISKLHWLQWYSEVTKAPVISPTITRASLEGMRESLVIEHGLLLAFLNCFGVLEILEQKQTKSQIFKIWHDSKIYILLQLR